MVVYAVFQGREEAEMGVKTQNVARIQDRPALNAAMQKIHDSREQILRMLGLAAANRQVQIRQPAINLTEHSRGSSRHDVGLPSCRVGKAHASENSSQVNMF